MKRLKILILVGILALVSAFGFAGCGKSSSVEILQCEHEEYFQNKISESIEKVKGAVVTLEVATVSTPIYGSGTILDIVNDDDQNAINKTYYIVTCHHVIKNAGEITVYTVDDKGKNFNDDGYNTAYQFQGKFTSSYKKDMYPITLVGSDPVSDIAVLRLKTDKELVKAQLPNLEKYTTTQGDSVFAIGNPTGRLPGTVSRGTISYLERTVKTAEVGYMKLMQVDIPTSGGNSGGPLFNYMGDYIGMTNAGTEGATNFNYSIPLAIKFRGDDRGIISVVTELIENETKDNYGYLSNRWNLGVTVKESGDYRSVTVDSLVEGGNLEVAGLRKGDKISSIEWGGKTHLTASVYNFEECVREMKTYLNLGDTFKLNYYRGNVHYCDTIELSVSGDIYLDTGK